MIRKGPRILGDQRISSGKLKMTLTTMPLAYPLSRDGPEYFPRRINPR